MAADDLVKGVIIGGLIGGALGILYAPKSGKETRQQIRDSAEDVIEKTKTQYDEAVRTIEKLAGRNKELFEAKKAQLKKALDAGVAAFNREKADICGPLGAP